MSFAPSYRLNNANVRFSTKMCLLGNYMHEGKEKKGGGGVMLHNCSQPVLLGSLWRRENRE